MKLFAEGHWRKRDGGGEGMLEEKGRLRKWDTSLPWTLDSSHVTYARTTKTTFAT